MKFNVFKTILFTIVILLSVIISVLIINNKSISTNGFGINNDLTLIIDAGHGGEDGGAVATDGTLEKDYNLDISLRLIDLLKIYGYNVISTRTHDAMTCDKGLRTQREKKISDIRNRLKLINSVQNPVFVSIHQNKFSDTTQKGSQVFYSKNNQLSKSLANEIQKSLVLNLQKENKRKIKQSGTEIYLLYHSSVPSVLVECGFLSNSDDLSKLKDIKYRNELSIAIADGIINFLNYTG
jgi:N-acetylmuramoyl-L-alanine amidase